VSLCLKTGEDAALKKAALAVVWLICFAVPLVVFPHSSDTVVVKLVVFTALSGVLLVLAGAAFFKRPEPLSSGIAIAAAASVFTVATLYRPSLYGLTRVCLVLSGSAVYLSASVFRLEPGKILLPLAWGAAAALAASLAMPAFGPRISGTFGNPNLLSSYAMAALPVGLGLFWGRGFLRITALVLFAGLCAAAMIQSGTRAPLVAIPAAAAVLFALKRRPGLLVLLVPVFAFAAVAFLFHDSAGVPVARGSVGVRQIIWQGSREMLAGKPLTGWGTGSFHLVFPGFRPGSYGRWEMPPNTAHAHSEPVELLAENGIAGFVFWLALLFLFLKKQTFREPGTVSNGEKGALAAFLMLSAECLFSVSLRWTTSFFFLVMVLSAMDAGSSGRKMKLPRWSGIFLAALGITLAGPLCYRTVLMTRSVLYHDRALESAAAGGDHRVSLDLCRRSLELHHWNLKSWMLMGDIYMNRATSTADLETRTGLLHSALAAWDSLEARAPGYGLLPFNRAVVHSHLGNWNAVLHEMTLILRHHDHLKPRAIDTAIAVSPLAEPSSSLRFMNLVHSSILAVEFETDSYDDSRFAVPPALAVIYALAANHSPGELPRMRADTDSLLARHGSGAIALFSITIERELALAADGHSLMAMFSKGLREGLEETCVAATEEPGVYAPYHRWLLCALAFETGAGNAAETARGLSSVLAESCYPAAGLFPGARHLYAVTGDIIPVGQGEMLLECFRHVMLLDAYGKEVMEYSDASVAEPSRKTLAFWRFNGGPFAEAYLEDAVPSSQMERIRRRSLRESPEVRLSMEITSAAVSLSSGSMNPAAHLEGFREAICPVVEELVEMHGAQRALELVNEAVESQREFLSRGGFPRGTAAHLNELRPVLLQCL
jgi:O-antigen ligase